MTGLGMKIVTNFPNPRKFMKLVSYVGPSIGIT